jgi:hypothetical protein
VKISRTFAVQVLFSSLAWCQSPPAEYQVNSAEVALTLNGQQGDAHAPASDVAWIGGSASITLEVSSQPTSVTLIAYESELLVSRSKGAFITASGQIINLAMGPSLVTVDVSAAMPSGVLQLPIPTALPGIFAFQALVTDASHPDGFRLSAPVILQVAVPTHTYLNGQVDLANLSARVFNVDAVHGVSFTNSYELSGESSSLTTGVARLSSPTLGTLTQTVVVDGTLGQILVGGVPATTIHDVFPVTFAEGGLFELTCEDPVSLTIAGMYLAPLTLTTYKTDLGTVIPTGGKAQPSITAQMADNYINSTSPGLRNRITQVAPPDPDYQCHGYTFLPPGVEKQLSPVLVEKILAENNYVRTDQVPCIIRPGDVIVYRDAEGRILHTGVVTETDPNGAVATKVRSKWGCMGVYDHTPVDVLPSYRPPGGRVEIYGSTRSGGNVLKDP